MIHLFSIAIAGTAHPYGSATVHWEQDGYAVIVDLRRGELLEAGPTERVSDHWKNTAYAEGSQYPYRGPGVVVSRQGSAEIVVHKGAMMTISQGFRVRKAGLPEHWKLAETVFGQDGGAGIALFDGELWVSTGRRKFDVMEVSASDFVAGGEVVLLNDDPDHYVDLWKRRLVENPVLEVSGARRQGGRWLGSQEGRALVWEESGAISYLASEKSTSNRMSSDGVLLASVDDVGKLLLVEVDTHEVHLEAWVCAGQPWPHGAASVTVVCDDHLQLVGPEGSSKLSRPPGEVRLLRRAGDHLSLVVGQKDQVGQVWRVPLDGGPARVVRHDPVQNGEVEGYRYGRPVRLRVRAVDGRPVERSTAKAYQRLLDAAAVDGVTVRVVSGFRTQAEQSVLYACWLSGNCNNGNQAARPGYSRHQSGHALDLNTHEPGVRDWLVAKGGEFGFYATVRSEPWHWEFHGRSAPTALAVEQLPLALPEEPPSLNIPWKVMYPK